MEVTLSCDTLEEFNSPELQKFVRQFNLLLSEYNNNSTIEEPADLFDDSPQWFAYIRLTSMIDGSYSSVGNGYVNQSSAVVSLVRKLDRTYGPENWHCHNGKFVMRDSRVGDLTIGYVVRKAINPNAG